MSTEKRKIEEGVALILEDLIEIATDLVVGVEEEQVELSKIKEWFDKETTCDCGECNLERLAVYNSIVWAMFNHILDDVEPEENVLDEWIAKLEPIVEQLIKEAEDEIRHTTA